MRLGVDGLRLMGRRVGVGRYIEYLLRAWSVDSRPFDDVRVYVPGALENPFEVRGAVRFAPLPGPRRPAFWEHAHLPWAKPKGDDLLFCPGYVVPLLARERCVVTHLGSYEAIPGAFSRWQAWRSKWQFARSCRRAAHVITVSESSRRDIERFYDVPSSHISVIPLGVDDRFAVLDEPAALAVARRDLAGDDRPFVLFVGKLTRRRHIPDLIAAFGLLKRRHGLVHRLVLVGPNPLRYDLQSLAREHGVEGDVRHHDYADHEALVVAYNAADAFIYPSAYEGFGMPVLEAMACGTPTVALDGSALPEFATGIARLLPDARPATLAAGLEAALFDAEFRERARRRGPARARKFRWQTIARRTLDLLATVAVEGRTGS